MRTHTHTHRHMQARRHTFHAFPPDLSTRARTHARTLHSFFALALLGAQQKPSQCRKHQDHQN